VVSAMRVANETGGGLAETLERTSTTVRRKLQMEDKIDALTSQGKLQAWVVGSMPIALMLVLNEIEPEGMHGLWHTTSGWIALAVIVVLEVIGVMLIRRITTIDV
jgi:tight adherence protein B